MKWLKYHIPRALVICLILLPGYATGQIAEIELRKDSSGLQITNHLSVYSSEEERTPQDAWALVQKSEHTGDYYYGFVQEFIWAGFSLSNQHGPDSWIIEVENPHLSFIEMYRRSGNGDWTLIGSTGRAMPFHTRNVEHTNFAFELTVPAGEQAEVLLMLDKRRSSLHYPVRVWNSPDFYQAQQRNYAFFGIYFGIFAIVILVSAIAYLISFDTKFLWYFLYVVSVGLFVFNDLGLAQKYIYPDSATIGGHARMGITYAMMISLNFFTISYFRTKHLYPAIHRFILGCCAVIGLIATVHTVFTEFAIYHATIVIISLYAAILGSIGAAIWAAVCFYKVEKNSAILFIAAFSFIFASGILFILGEFGLIVIPPSLFTPLQIASVFEIMFLSVGIAWQIRIAEKQRLTLNDKVARLENENLRSYIKGTEKERTRVAMELHDAIGSRLSQLSRDVGSEKTEALSIKKEIKTILQKVRYISHKLSPSGLTMFGLTTVVEQMVKDVNQKSTIHYAFQSFDIPEGLPEDSAIQLYRIIQESIQNIEKHSSAENAEIQLIGQENQIVLTIEDDGVGFNQKENGSNGIGLYNIRKRVAYFGGDLSISAKPGEGVGIVVTMPLSK